MARNNSNPQQVRPYSDTAKAFLAASFPEQLYKCGGLIQALQNIRNAYAIRKQPEGAFLGALADMSFLCGRSFAVNYNGSLIAPNLYALFLANSGMGKEIIRRVGAEVAKIYRPNEPLPESFASVQAFQNLISRLKKVYWLHDEFERDLAVMDGKKTNSNITGVITESLKLYSNANNRNYLPKLIAQESKGSKSFTPVDRPSLTIFATGNPREFFNAMSVTLLNNAYITRFTTIHGRNYSEKKAVTFEEASNTPPFCFPSDVQSIIKRWAGKEMERAVGPLVAKFDRSAFDCFMDFDATIDREIKQESTAWDGAREPEFKARISEKVWKYALLFGVSEEGANPNLMLKRREMELAVALARYELDSFAAIKEWLGCNIITNFMSEVLEWGRGLEGCTFSKSQFTRRFQKRGTSRERDEVLLTLLEGEYITEVEVITKGRARREFRVNA